MRTAFLISPIRRLLFAVLFASILGGMSGSAQELSSKEIIQRSVEVNRRDWDAAPSYDYTQRDRENGKIRTTEQIMLAGSRYARLIAVDDKPLSPEDDAKEQRRLQKTIAQRRQESPSEREQRVGQYQKEIDQDHVLIGEMTKALDFTLVGKKMLGRHEVYVLKGTPQTDYHPPNKEAKALTGMQGTLWIDAVNFHWVKAEAEVVRPIWMYGFIARVEPGTRFEFEQEPIATGLWMPSHFSMQANAKVLLLFQHSEQDDVTYFNYHTPGANSAEAYKVR